MACQLWVKFTMTQLTLIRHGQSEWNHEDRFTGWADVDLTADGLEQMRLAGRQLVDEDMEFDLAYTSVLRRCIRSQWTLLDAMDCMWLPQRFDWRLNERHYGALTGTLRSEAEAMYGEKAVWQWRRSYNDRPPAMPDGMAIHIERDRRYFDVPFAAIPRTESLRDTVKRVQAVWDDSITVSLRAGKRVLVVAHGNCLRALTKMLENLSDQEIASIEVPNAAPIIYTLDAQLKPARKRILPPTPQLVSGIL